MFFIFPITSFELEEMFLGHTDGLSESRSSRDQLLPYAESDDDTADSSEPILFSASFEELADNIVKYDTVIWLSISLMLVLAWGVGIIMLLYLPFKRYILQKDISSRKLYVTPSEIVYKVHTLSVTSFFLIFHKCDSSSYLSFPSLFKGFKAFLCTLLGHHHN